MSKKYTMRDNKEVILERLHEVEAQLEEQKSKSFNPTSVKEESTKKEIAVKAKGIINMNILNSEIVDGYNAVLTDIANKKAELKELFDIEANANTLAALIQAHDIELSEFNESKDKLLAEKQEELKALQLNYETMKKDLAADIAKKKEENELAKEREEENYNYDLARRRKLENDIWEDEKARREKEISDREDAIKAKEAEIEQIKALNEELMAKVDEIPQLIAEAEAKAAEKATKECERIAAIKSATIRKEAELDKTLIQKELDSCKEALAKSEEENTKLNERLDAAYKQMEQIATKSVVNRSPYLMSDSKESK